MVRSARIAVLALAVTFGCETQTAGTNGESQAMPPVSLTSEALAQVRTARIYFGHQSVGNNVLQGIQELSAEYPDVSIPIVESRELDSVSGPGIIHFRAGRNGDPVLKMQDFRDRLAVLGPADTGIALLKLCYVDVNADTDADSLFAEYEKFVDAVRQDHPSMRLVHVTMPLMAPRKTTLRSFVKQLLGRAKKKPDANPVRNRYNDLMRQTYGNEPMFDIAAIEATHLDGQAALGTVKGDTVQVLAAELTSDGGHLNDVGRRIVAAALLEYLAGVQRAQNP